MSTTTFIKKTLGLETAEPGVTPRTNTEASFARKPKLSAGKSKKRDIPEGLWTKCPKCATMIPMPPIIGDLQMRTKGFIIWS